MRKCNERYNGGLSVVKQLEEQHVKATQIHHIFPAAQYPTISDFIENLIALTPNQHYSMAHPNNQTAYIDKDFQYVCLIAKTETIRNDLTQTYSFDDYKIVLNVGLHTDDFNHISDLDYVELLKKIDSFFSHF